jgi:hypothetical protein
MSMTSAVVLLLALGGFAGDTFAAEPSAVVATIQAPNVVPITARLVTSTFLYRTVVGRENPNLAFEAVARVWLPRGPWKRLMVEQLHKAAIAFDPY